MSNPASSFIPRFSAGPHIIVTALIASLTAMTACSPPQPSEESPSESAEVDATAIPSPPAGFDAVPVPKDNPVTFLQIGDSSSSARGGRLGPGTGRGEPEFVEPH